MSITNAVFDLVASDPSLRYLEILRNEAASVVASDNGIWTKQGIARMLKIDSALRESSRMGSFVGALARVVVSPNGTTAPNGTFCPYGSMISVPTTPVQNDPMLYPSPGTYQPFRFSSQREAHHLEGNDSQDESKVTNTEEYIKKANLSFVSTSASYHPFGHGRHACPGRFFAANELKMLLAYMVLNYDFDMQPSRPNNNAPTSNEGNYKSSAKGTIRPEAGTQGFGNGSRERDLINDECFDADGYQFQR
nr:hypothetical protein LTR18_004006 [Exophiala xenobiotica]